MKLILQSKHAHFVAKNLWQDNKRIMITVPAIISSQRMRPVSQKLSQNHVCVANIVTLYE